MTRNQLLGLAAAGTVLAAVGWQLSRPRQRPELPRRDVAARRVDQVRPSDTPQRKSDTPQRTSDTPQRASDTPQRTASDTPQRIASDTPQRVLPGPKPAFSCADARESAVRDVREIRLRAGSLWPVPSAAEAVVFDQDLGEPLGFLIDEPGEAAVLDLWANRAGAVSRSSAPRRVSASELPVVSLSGLKNAALTRALRSAYPPAVRRLGGRPAPPPASVRLERPELISGPASPRPARRGFTACVFSAPGRRDLILARDGGALAAWPSMTEALYEEAADVVGFSR